MGISVDKLIDKSGLTVPMISAYENGRRYPNAYTLWRLAEALDCIVDDLYIKIE